MSHPVAVFFQTSSAVVSLIHYMWLTWLTLINRINLAHKGYLRTSRPSQTLVKLYSGCSSFPQLLIWPFSLSPQPCVCVCVCARALSLAVSMQCFVSPCFGDINGNSREISGFSWMCWSDGSHLLLVDRVESGIGDPRVKTGDVWHTFLLYISHTLSTSHWF